MAGNMRKPRVEFSTNTYSNTDLLSESEIYKTLDIWAKSHNYAYLGPDLKIEQAINSDVGYKILIDGVLISPYEHSSYLIEAKGNGANSTELLEGYTKLLLAVYYEYQKQIINNKAGLLVSNGWQIENFIADYGDALKFLKQNIPIGFMKVWNTSAIPYIEIIWDW